MDEYNKLVGVNEIDHEKARQLAKLNEEIETLKRRTRFLKEIADKHKNLNEYLWRTQDGKYMLVHDMNDEHLKNAVRYVNKEGFIPFVLQQEYVKRFGDTLPDSKQTGAGNLLSSGKKNKCKTFEEEDDDWF